MTLGLQSLDAPIHNPDSRPLLLKRRGWSVRAAQGQCRYGLVWLGAGLWHLQFSQSSGQFAGSVLCFPKTASVPEPFLVLTRGLIRSVWMSPTSLDEFVQDQTGEPGPSGAMYALTAIIFEQTLSAAGRTAVANPNRHRALELLA